ncbi:MAG: protein-glutamine gamma-glutamyltransferase, partial [Solirubrobacteraceae bacterium]|nr:protein-glutamine gamma-glutamyltransferase [Solirubrobacteraceae bacterium]
LAAYGAHAWMQMVGPPAWDALALALCAALAAGAALAVLAGREPGRAARAAATALAGAIVLLVAFAAAGVPADLAGPRAWDDLAQGIGQGLATVPNVRVPYRGVEEWTRTVIVLGGGLLIGLAALLAFAPRRAGRLGFPVAAAVALGTLYLVPVMQRAGEHPFLGGATFALLMALFLWLERVERSAARFAAGAVAIALLSALIVAPRVDGSGPVLDYEGIAQSLTTPSTRYDWNHSYGPLSWPRDGSEVLRVRANYRAYWKAANLPTFDGLRWKELGNLAGTRLDSGLQFDHPRWQQELRVTFRGLRSEQFVTAGTTLAIEKASRTPIQTEPGQFTVLDRPLRPGNAYRAFVYAPQPGARELRDAHALALPDDDTLTAVTLPDPDGGDPATAVIPPWGAPSPRDLAEIEDSAYARAYTLARRLRAQSATPYDFVLAVESYLSHGFAYSERPIPSRVPLMEFLFGERRGYCQQFSGAMALLLRFGGVPVRVAAGFSPGAYDRQRREFVVRDLDAHSWVEVFFPGIGWVTRDPTPSASPARSQLADLLRAGKAQPVTAGAGAAAAPVPRADRAPTITPGRSVASERSRGRRVAIAIAIALASLAVAVVVLRRRRRSRGATIAYADGPLGELQRALVRSGRSPAPQTTLDALAARWRDTPAEGYVRSLAASRYGFGDGAGPTRSQRTALRRELGAGGGWRGRLRAWWALPPHAGRRGSPSAAD